jgi:TatD DNase family protein
LEEGHFADSKELHMLIDSHCHLDFPDLSRELDAVMARAAMAGIGAMITVSTRIRRFDQIRTIAERYAHVACSVGTHPHYADEEADIPLAEMLALANHPKVVAFGEAGLDYYRKNCPPEPQQEGFRKHIAAARETGLPLIIHTREAEQDTLRILTEEMEKGPFKALLHCYTSSKELMEQLLPLGVYVSFSGVLTFKKMEALRETAAIVPVDRILLETDAPYLAPEPHRGKRNEPAFVKHTAAVLAKVKGVSEADIARITTENFFRLFNKAEGVLRGTESSAA